MLIYKKINNVLEILVLLPFVLLKKKICSLFGLHDWNNGQICNIGLGSLSMHDFNVRLRPQLGMLLLLHPMLLILQDPALPEKRTFVKN